MKRLLTSYKSCQIDLYIIIWLSLYVLFIYSAKACLRGKTRFCLGIYNALQITFRLSPVQIINFLCPIDEISVIRASIEHKKLTI
jgi:hypothetical protein